MVSPEMATVVAQLWKTWYMPPPETASTRPGPWMVKLLVICGKALVKVMELPRSSAKSMVAR